MTIELQSVPITNQIDLRVTFLLQNVEKLSLRHGEASNSSFRFDSIQIGNMEPLDIYYPENQGKENWIISPGNIAFLERTSEPKKLLYAMQFQVKQNRLLLF